MEGKKHPQYGQSAGRKNHKGGKTRQHAGTKKTGGKRRKSYSRKNHSRKRRRKGKK